MVLKMPDDIYKPHFHAGHSLHRYLDLFGHSSYNTVFTCYSSYINVLSYINIFLIYNRLMVVFSAFKPTACLSAPFLEKVYMCAPLGGKQIYKYDTFAQSVSFDFVSCTNFSIGKGLIFGLSKGTHSS